MDIFTLIYIIVMILMALAMLLILPFLSYILYSHLRKKGKIYKNIALSIFIATIIGMILLVIKIITSPDGFGPTYETVIINQKIGGKLLCQSVYSADQHSWEYSIGYKYINPKGDTIALNYGSYCGKEWKKNEQIVKYNNFLILKTCDRFDYEKLIIKDTQTDSTKIFNIDFKLIQSDSLWIAKIFSSEIENNPVSLKFLI